VRQPQIAIASKSTVRAGLLSDHEQTGSYLIPIASGLAILKLMAISAFMGSQLIACRLPKADCALFTVVALSPPVRFRLFFQVDQRRRGSPFAAASDPGGSRNGSTEMRS
jgi:hypothetical protein